MEQLQHPLAAGAARPAHRDPMGGWEPQLCGALISGHLGPFLCPLSSAKPLREEPGDWQKMGTFTSKWAHSPSKWALSPPNGHFYSPKWAFSPNKRALSPNKWALSPPKGALSPQNGHFHPINGHFHPKMGAFTPEASAQPQALQCWCTEQGSPPEGHQTRLFCLFPEPRSKQPTRSTQSRGFS